MCLADIAAELEGYPGSGGAVVPPADLLTQSDMAPSSSGHSADDALTHSDRAPSSSGRAAGDTLSHSDDGTPVTQDDISYHLDEVFNNQDECEVTPEVPRSDQVHAVERSQEHETTNHTDVPQSEQIPVVELTPGHEVISQATAVQSSQGCTTEQSVQFEVSCRPVLPCRRGEPAGGGHSGVEAKINTNGRPPRSPDSGP